MLDREIRENIEFQGKELRDIVEHSVILGSSRISDKLDQLYGEIEQLNEHVEKINESLRVIADRMLL